MGTIKNIIVLFYGVHSGWGNILFLGPLLIWQFLLGFVCDHGYFMFQFCDSSSLVVVAVSCILELLTTVPHVGLIVFNLSGRIQCVVC